MFRRSLFAAGLGVAALLATASVAVAHGGARGGPVRGLVRSLQTVELTEAQQADLDELVASLPTREPGERAHHDRRGTPPTPEEREARRATRQAHKALLLDQLAKETPDAEALHAMIDGGPRGTAPAEAHDVLDEVLAFHATLSAEQRTAWVNNLQSAMESRGRRGWGRRHGPACDDAAEG